jgi:hypothetical protein
VWRVRAGGWREGRVAPPCSGAQGAAYETSGQLYGIETRKRRPRFLRDRTLPAAPRALAAKKACRPSMPGQTMRPCARRPQDQL